MPAAEVAEIDEVPAPGDEEQSRSDDIVLLQVQERGVEPDEQTVVVADPTAMTIGQVVRYVLRVRTNLAIIIKHPALGYLFLAGLRTFAVLFARGHSASDRVWPRCCWASSAWAPCWACSSSGRLATGFIRRGSITPGSRSLLLRTWPRRGPALTGLVSRSLVVSLPLLILGTAALAAPTRRSMPPSSTSCRRSCGAGRKGSRTALRNTLEAFGPLLFGLVAALFGAGAASSSRLTPAELARQGHGLEAAFLLMLVPLGAAGVYLLVKRALLPPSMWPRAGPSERLGKEHTRGVA